VSAVVRHVVPSLAALGDVGSLDNWFTDIVDSVKDAINDGIDSIFDASVSVMAWASSNEGRATIAGIAKAQTDFIMHPTLERLGTFLSTYGVIIASAVIPGAGWVLAAALLARGLIRGEVSLAETIGKVIVQVYPQASYVVALVNHRGEGLREMLLAAALSSMPPQVAALVAFARHPRGALTEYALGLLPENARELAKSALNGTLKQDALGAVLGALPPEVAAAVACAQDPKGTAATWAIRRLPPDLQTWATAAVSGSLDRSLVAQMLQKTGEARPLMALAFAAEDMRDLYGPQVDQWRQQAEAYSKSLDALKLRVRNAENGLEKRKKQLDAVSWNFAENNRILAAEGWYAAVDNANGTYSAAFKAALAHADAAPSIITQAEAHMALDLKTLSEQVADTTAKLTAATKRGDDLAAQVQKATADLATAKAAAAAADKARAAAVDAIATAKQQATATKAEAAAALDKATQKITAARQSRDFAVAARDKARAAAAAAVTAQQQAAKRAADLAEQVKKAAADLATAKAAQVAADKARAAAVAAVATAQQQATATKAEAAAALAHAAQQVAAAQAAQRVAEKARAAAEASATATTKTPAPRLTWLQWYTRAA
jgi:hypothetical protein